MSDGTASLRRKIGGAGDLQSVVRTMKALAASNIGQYEKSVSALSDYARTVELGLGACFRQLAAAPVDPIPGGRARVEVIGAVVFGSDQGLVGRFNEVIADHALNTLEALPGTYRAWAIGERVHARLLEAGLEPAGLFSVPGSVMAIAPLVGQILIESESGPRDGPLTQLHLFYNRPTPAAGYEPASQQLLPLDEQWRRSLAELPWPAGKQPEVLGDGPATLRALIREYLFICLFRASAESLASENKSRLAAMQRADQNIDELLEQLRGKYHRVRQGSIDEELFDVTSGFEAFSAQG